MRLINADALIEAILDARRIDTETIPKLIRLIDAQPTIEPTVAGTEMSLPKRGRWMPNFIDKDIRNGLYFFCSECGEEMPPSKVFYPYCPNCGARMEAER